MILITKFVCVSAFMCVYIIQIYIIFTVFVLSFKMKMFLNKMSESYHFMVSLNFFIHLLSKNVIYSLIIGKSRISWFFGGQHCGTVG